MNTKVMALTVLLLALPVQALSQDCPSELYACLLERRQVKALLTNEVIKNQQYIELLNATADEINRLRRILRVEKRRKRQCRRTK